MPTRAKSRRPRRSASAERGFARRRLLLAIGLPVLVLGLAAGGFAVLHKKSGGPGGGIANWKAGCTSQARVSMTHQPMDLADVATIAPLGLTAGAHVTPIDHLYFYPKSQQRDAAPVYAMADGRIIEISERTQSVDSGKAKQGEYRLIFQHSCQTISYFDLVTSLDPAIAAKWKNHNQSSVSIPVKSGQVIGRIGGQTLDTSVYNLNLTLPGFIHPAMYVAEPWKVHTDDFFSYFSEPLLSPMLALNTRKIKPYSGKIDYDQPGKLIGNWFLAGTNGYAGPKDAGNVGHDGHGYWNGHLSIHYDAIDGHSIVVSVGQFGPGGQPTAFAVPGNSPDPAQVTSATGLVKYELTQKNPDIAPAGSQLSSFHEGPVLGVALFQVLPGEKLKYEILPGKTAAQVSGFTPAAKTYER